MSNYKKPFLSLPQQLALLKSRGLEITDDATALSYLGRIGYYRFSAYWYSLRKTKLTQDPLDQRSVVHREDAFCPGSRFQHVLELYVFDKRLRLLMLDAIERIEVSLRVAVSYQLGAKDPFAHTKPDLLHGHFTKQIQPKTGKTRHQDWLDKYKLVLGRSKEDFVRHYKQKYGLPMPIWVSVEIWDFGMLSTFYQGMSVADKSAIASKYVVPDWKVMESWFRTLNFVRNVAAHHSRLWNKNLVDQPKLPAKGTMPDFDSLIGEPNISSRLFVVLCILLHFMRSVSPGSSWPMRLKELINNFPQVPNLSVADMGFPSDWEQLAVWK